MEAFDGRVLKNSTIGVAIHEVIYEGSEPIDYRFVDVNQAFLQMTGFGLDIIGKTVLQVSPNIGLESRDWIQLFGDVATHMTNYESELYLEALGKWYIINVYSPEKGYFVVMLSPFLTTTSSISADSISKQIYYRNESLLKVYAYQTNSERDFLDYALDEAIRLSQSDIGYIYFYNEDTKEFNLNSWSKDVMNECTIVEKQTKYMLKNIGFWGEVVRQRRAIINNDFQSFHPLKKGFPEGHAPLKRYMSLPIIESGEIVAVIGLANKSEPYTEEDIYQVQKFIEDVWNVFKRRQAEIALESEREQLRTTVESIVDGIITLDPDLKIIDFNQMAYKILKVKDKEILYLDLFSILSDYFHELKTYIDQAVVSIKKSKEKTIQKQFADRQTIVFDLDGKEDLILSVALSAIISEKNMIQGYVLVLRDITKEFRDSEKIKYMSYHDALTGLYNRRFFEAEFQRLHTIRQLPLTIIMGDLNGLKLANDAFGHLVGDQLLVEVARILLVSCRKEDIVARWGGDEFVLLLPQTDEARAKDIIDTIKDLCNESSEQVVEVSISLGHSTRDHLESLNVMIKEAEDRLYYNKLSEGKSQRSSIIEAIQASLYERDHETREHGLRLYKYAKYIAEELELSEDDKNQLELLAMLHDIGKIGVPDSILLKDGPLTDEEWVEMKKHSAVGYRIALSSPDLRYVADLILHHHECFDGSGYPDQLKGGQIPLLSRIISIVDAYDAMVSDRPYRKALEPAQALEEIRKQAGHQFDPNLTRIFLEQFTFQSDNKE